MLLGLSLPSLPPTPAIAQASRTQSSAEVASRIKGVTLAIKSDFGLGSGTIVRRQGKTYTVLTAAHVVRSGNTDYQIIAPDGKQYPVVRSAIRRLNGVDLAMVEFQSDRTYPVVEMGSSQWMTEGSVVYVAGFPMNTAAITESVYSFTEGKLTARSDRAFVDGYALVYNNNTLPGMSGGGVYDAAGRLIGVHGKGDVQAVSTPSPVNVNVRIKTGFNLGIPIETFATQARNFGINITIVLPNTARAPNPTNSIINDSYIAAIVRAQEGDYRAAIVELTKGIDRAPNDRASAKLYNLRATYYLITGQSELGFRDLDRTIALDPRNGNAYLTRANYRHANSDTTGAIEDLTQAIRIDPNNLQAYLLRATLNVGTDRPSAIADYGQMIRIDPRNALAYTMRAAMRFQEGDSAGAIADYTKLIELNPRNLDAYQYRANIYRATSNLDAAIADYTKMIQIAPRNPQGYLMRANLRADREDLDGAIADYTEIIKFSPRNADVYYQRAQLYDRQKKYTNAIADYTKLIELQPFQQGWYIGRASLREKIGDRPGMAADYRKLSELALRQGNRRESEDWLRRATEAENPSRV
jgi:tetratricopeptide (TPR) repeat protein